MHFASPQRLYWLALLVPMAAAAGYYWFWYRRTLRRVGDVDLVDAMAPDRSHGLRVVRMALIVVAVVALVLAAARPQWGKKSRTVEQQGVDVVFALDLSKSMLARDVAPTRLESASVEIEEVLDRLDGDRVGMVVFTLVSFVQSPLTTDYSAIEFYLEKLDPTQMSVGGTAIGDAIRDGAELLTGKSLGEEDDSQATRSAKLDRAKNQILVVITDGEDHQSDPVAVAERARDRGVHVVTVGIGTDEGTKIPILGDDGEIEGYKRNKRGETIETQLQEDQLREIARKGGGIYVRYQGRNSVADKLSTFIDELQASTFESEKAQRYEDRFVWFLLPGVLFLIAAFVVGERRSGRFGWGAPDGDSKGWTIGPLAGLLLLVAVPAQGCGDLLRSPQSDVESGNEAYQNGDWKGALEHYQSAREALDPTPSMVFYNLGLAHLEKEEHEKARQRFGRALDSPEASDRFSAHFNLGISLARKEKWQPAIDAWKKALRLAAVFPDAIADDRAERARHNVELAYRRLYPPCSTLEDDYEENDKPSAAAELGKKPDASKDLTLCGTDADWYRVPVQPGAEVTVDASFSRLRDPPDPARAFLPNPQALELAVFGAKGEERIAGDSGDAAEESAPEPPVERNIDTFEVDEETPIGSKNQVLIRVRAADQMQYSYDLSVDVVPPCRALEDEFEENDDRDSAADLEPGEHQMQICPGDEDWFRLDVDRNNALFVDVAPTRTKKRQRPDPDDLEVELLDAESGEAVGDMRRDGRYWTGGKPAFFEERELLVRVKGDDARGAYSLVAKRFPPCPVGDDKYEENDEIDTAAELPAKKREHRYLRLCPDDPDAYVMKPKKPKRGRRPGSRPKSGSPGGPGGGKTGDTKKRFSVGLIDAVDDEDPPGLDLFDPESGDMIAPGRDPADADDATAQNSSSGESRLDRVASLGETERDSVAVRVTGDATFYHLVDPSNRNRRQQKQQRRSDRNEQSEKDQKKKSDQSDQKKRADKSQRQDDKKKKKKKKSRAQKKKANEKRRMKDILRALRNSDENFQMRNALEDEDRKNVEKDW